MAPSNAQYPVRPGTILAEIVAHKREELAQWPVDLTPPPPLEGQPWLAALTQPGVRLICEVKPKSPSAGVLAPDFQLSRVLDAYRPYAAALSVLTDARYFGGSLDLLSDVSAQVSQPTLCKDFLLDERQVWAARRAGASAALLIVKILDDETLARLHASCRSVGLTPVVEVQTEAELARALTLSPECLLINHRDLETFEIDLGTTARLAPAIPPGVVTIAASGLETRDDLARLLPFTNCFLIGSALMRESDAAGRLADLVQAQPKAAEA